MVRKLESQIGRMLQALIEDLKNGVNQSQAGYRDSDAFDLKSTEERELIRSKIVQKNFRGMIRISFNNQIILKRLKRSFDLQEKQLQYFLKTADLIKSDMKSLDTVSRILGRACEVLRSSPQKWAIVIALGWWKMLESSGMPGLADEILKEGFSPKDWTLKAISSTVEFATEVAKEFGEIDYAEQTSDFLKEIGLRNISKVSLSSGTDPETIRKIKKIIRWTQSMEQLTPETIKMLGFFWFSIFILESANLFPTSEEVSPRFIDTIWRNIEGLLGKGRSALFNELEETTDTINTMIEQSVGKKVTWAENIFHLPELI